MKAIDPVVEALVALCQREGGHKIVASEAHISPDNLWQIVNGTMLPSGKPRGVGPDVRRRLTSRYPEWLKPVTAATVAAQSEGPALRKFSPEARACAAMIDKLPAAQRLELQDIIQSEVLARIPAQYGGEEKGLQSGQPINKPGPAGR